jgi:carbonic anhydrase
MTSALEALQRLREGNRRFVSRDMAVAPVAKPDAKMAAEQTPFAIILGCSDSRVPSEIVFDQGLGELFVIRVAGNIVAPSQIGSVEFAAATFATRLVVVMGHSHCGAVQATIDQLRQPTQNRSPNLRSIVGRISPVVQRLMEQGPVLDEAVFKRQAVRANIHASVDQLRQGSAILERLTREEGLLITGAEYSLDTGVVDFFDDHDVG